jgi:hypothetical protein
METPELTYKTLRDEIAIAAMQVLMQDYPGDQDETYLAAEAYRMADSMLKARESNSTA